MKWYITYTAHNPGDAYNRYIQHDIITDRHPLIWLAGMRNRSANGFEYHILFTMFVEAETAAHLEDFR